MSRRRKHGQLKRKTFLWVICLMTILCMGWIGISEHAKAETVTDTLTIKIGYWGMPEKDYVTKAEYHWTELQQNLEIHEQAYSFFRDKENRSYAVIVAAARGFYLEDLLNYAGVNISDVQNISFYTNDYAAGAFTSFTPYQLLEEPRYYFDNLASHINNQFNDAGILVGYEVDPSAYDNREQALTMLALESNWETFEAGTENTNPVWSGLSTGSRFRLLFGQSDPTEMRTNQSAKYVHTIALTIPGSPEIRGSSGDYSGKIMLSKEIGKHTVNFNVASDEAMLETIKQKLVWSSSDDRILRIENVSMEQSAEYDDAVSVQIDYEVLKEGNASIEGNFMGMKLSGSVIETDDSESGGESDTGKTDKDGSKKNGSGKKDSGTSNSGKNSGSSKSGSNQAPTSNTPRNLSLVNRGGTVAQSNPPGTITAAQAAADAEQPAEESGMVPMDLTSVFETDEMNKPIVMKDDSKQYAPLIYGGVGTMLLMGGIASALSFKAQMGTLTIRLRRRRI